MKKWGIDWAEILPRLILLYAIGWFIVFTRFMFIWVPYGSIPFSEVVSSEWGALLYLILGILSITCVLLFFFLLGVREIIGWFIAPFRRNI